MLLRAVSASDRLLAMLRPTWLWLGQAGVVVLGTHLAADRLDDEVLRQLEALGGWWLWPDHSVAVAAWTALTLEFLVSAWATLSLWDAFGAPRPTWQQWKNRATVGAVLRPIFWVPVSLTGAWCIGMAAEDALLPYAAPAAAPIGWLVALLVAWRLSWTGTVRVVSNLPSPGRRVRGLVLIPLLLPIAILSTWQGLPIWGWLP